MTNQRGAGLLELLLGMAVFMAVLPFAYEFAMQQKEDAENAAIIGKIGIVKTALEQYISDNRQALLAPVGSNVTRVKLSELKGARIDKEDAEKIQLRIVKSKDSGGRAFVQGIVIFDSPDLTPLRTRQIALAGGASSGFADGKMLYGSFGTWQTPTSSMRAPVGVNSILTETKTFRSGGDYLQRLPSSNPMDATIQSNLDLGEHNITNAKNITASGIRFLDTFETESIETSTMSVANRLDWTAPLDIFGDSLVNGAITSDGRSIDATSVAIAGRSIFRSLTAENLTAENLYLSGFSVASNIGEPPVLLISGTLDMTRGHISAIDAYVGFSGSIAPKLIVSDRIEDSANSEFYWNLSSGGDAVLADLYLPSLSENIKTAYIRERTGKTETERLMSAIIMNSNATVADYMRILDQVKKTVAAKYEEIKN